MSGPRKPPVARVPGKLRKLVTPVPGKLRKLVKPVPERLRKLVAPVPEKLRDWLDSQVERELRAIARQFPQPNDLTRPQPPKPKRKPGAGAPRRFTEEEVAEGRKIFHAELRKKQKLRQLTYAKQVAHLQNLFRPRREASLETWVRHIIRPVLDQSRRSPRPRR